MEKLQHLSREVEDNLESQSKLLPVLIETYAKLSETRRTATETYRRQEAFIQDLLSAYETFSQILMSLKRAEEFVDSMQKERSRLKTQKEALEKRCRGSDNKKPQKSDNIAVDDKEEHPSDNESTDIRKQSTSYYFPASSSAPTTESLDATYANVRNQTVMPADILMDDFPGQISIKTEGENANQNTYTNEPISQPTCISPSTLSENSRNGTGCFNCPDSETVTDTNSQQAWDRSHHQAHRNAGTNCMVDGLHDGNEHYDAKILLENNNSIKSVKHDVKHDLSTQQQNKISIEGAVIIPTTAKSHFRTESATSSSEAHENSADDFLLASNANTNAAVPRMIKSSDFSKPATANVNDAQLPCSALNLAHVSSAKAQESIRCNNLTDISKDLENRIQMLKKRSSSRHSGFEQEFAFLCQEDFDTLQYIPCTVARCKPELNRYVWLSMMLILI